MHANIILLKMSKCDTSHNSNRKELDSEDKSHCDRVYCQRTELLHHFRTTPTIVRTNYMGVLELIRNLYVSIVTIF